MKKKKKVVEKRKKKKVMEIPRPSREGLKCPLCGNRTLCRDVAPDGWYVEWCAGGRLAVLDKEVDEDGVEQIVRHEFNCPYWWAGFGGKRK